MVLDRSRRSADCATLFATYRYRVRWEDAAAFKQRMDTDPDFLKELVGLFNAHRPANPKPKPEPVFKPTQKNCRLFKKWLTQRRADEPDTLPTQRAAELLGYYPQKLHRWVKLGQLRAEQVGRFQYCSKAELIAFLATPERMMGGGEVGKEFIAEEKGRS